MEKSTSIMLRTIASSEGRLLLGQLIMLVNIRCLPRITNPDIVNRASRQVSILLEHILGKVALLLLILVL
jgi:hypothetical protein